MATSKNYFSIVPEAVKIVSSVFPSMISTELAILAPRSLMCYSISFSDVISLIKCS